MHLGNRNSPNAYRKQTFFFGNLVHVRGYRLIKLALAVETRDER